MKKILYPQRGDWPALQARPDTAPVDLEHLISKIFSDIRQQGDKALYKYCAQYDGTTATAAGIRPEAIAAAAALLPEDLKAAIQLAAGNIRRFHETQREAKQIVDTMPGVRCWREARPVETVGLYIPGGSAPLFSTVLMLGIPAQLAGCSNIVLCTPPQPDGSIHPVILYAASCCGITRIFGIGGIQAIAAMTFGTETIFKADKLFGPGNQYVTAAKQKAQQSGTAIDMPAGPSEVLVIADQSCNPAFVAADLLSQAEHGPDSQVILLTDQGTVADAVLAELERQVKQLPRAPIAIEALMQSHAIVLPDLDTCFEFSNGYAPEHLIVAIDGATGYTGSIRNAGSVFLGHYSCETAGDYASGTNHTLPTNGYARSYSGLSLDSFLKKITFQEISREGIRNIGPAIEQMAAAEQLWGHKNAVTLRLEQCTQ